MITISAISKRFDGIRALDGCSFEIVSDSITGLIGPNGAGKTTLFNIVTGFLQPDAGRILFNGRDVTGLPPYVLFNLGLMRTFQIPRMFERMTVLENLLLVPSGQSGENLVQSWLHWRRVLAQEHSIRRKAKDVLDFLQLTQLTNEYAGKLSGGQKKLVELGRTLMTDASVMLLDEPVAGVNPTLTHKLCEHIRLINRELNRTICLIEHDMDVIGALCDQVVVMAEGRVLVEGDMDTIRSNKAVQAAYLGVRREAAV